MNRRYPPGGTLSGPLAIRILRMDEAIGIIAIYKIIL